MKNLKPPRVDEYKSIQRNLHKMKQNIMHICEYRLEAPVINAIVNTAFDSDTLKQYNVKFMEFRAKCKELSVDVVEGITESNFALYFDSVNLQKKRLAFLETFLDDALEYQLLFHKGARAKKGGNPRSGNQAQCASGSDGDHTSFLINKPERYKCELCATNHPGTKTGRARRWLFANTCLVFQNWSADKKDNHLRRYKLCRVCSTPSLTGTT